MATQLSDQAFTAWGTQVETSCWQAFANLAQSLLRERDEEAIVQMFLSSLPHILPVSFRAVSLRPRAVSLRPRSRGGYWWAAGYCDERPLSARLLDRIAGLSQRGHADEILLLTSPLMAAHQGLVIDPQRFGLSELNRGPILAAAIKTGRAQFGILLVGKGDEICYSTGEHLRLCLLANQLAHALETAALYADTLHRDREIALIYQTGQRITQLLDLSALMPQLVVAVSETFGYESVTLLLVDEATHELVVKETHGLNKERHLGFRIPITDTFDGGIVGWVAHHGKPYLATNVRKEARYLKTVEETRSELDVPLKIKGRVIGVLDVQSTRVGGVTEKDRYILETLADQIAIALENARLYEDLAGAHKQLQLLLERTVYIQEQERRRIAADIHDDVSQLLYAALYEAQAGLQLLPSDPVSVLENLQNIQTSLDRAISEVRKTIFDLWPTSLDEMGLLPSVQSYLTRFEKASSVVCELKIKGTPIAFTPLARINIYRILQEALHNVHKHAQATSVEISFSFRRSKVLVSIYDDGSGFNSAEFLKEADRHLGLISMRERARSVGGQLRIKSGPGEGTVLIFEFPRESVGETP